MMDLAHTDPPEYSDDEETGIEETADYNESQESEE